MAENETPNLIGDVTAAEDLRSPITRTLFNYWQTKRGDRPYPAWTDIQLMDIHKIVPHVVVRDVLDGGREFRCRFSGTGLSLVLGVDGTGQLIAETYKRGAAGVLARYRSVLNAGQPMRAVAYVEAVEKNLPTAFESVYLPLAGADGTIGHIIVAYDFTYVPTPDEPRAPGSLR
ncbi:PAS domain-containing protein [bacterium SCSIO 12827]|nr:PAS domain-containing protein [bacterium SCSIO 12827]